MKINDILNETGVGGIAGVAMPMGKMNRRIPGMGTTKKKKKTNEDVKCKACGDTGTVHWDHQDEFTGDHVPASAPCPECELGKKKKTNEGEGSQVFNPREKGAGTKATMPGGRIYIGKGEIVKHKDYGWIARLWQTEDWRGFDSQDDAKDYLLSVYKKNNDYSNGDDDYGPTGRSRMAAKDYADLEARHRTSTGKLKFDDEVECKKCKGKGCDHCDGQGYHTVK